MSKVRKKNGETAELPSKTFERAPNKVTLMAGGIISGDPYPPMLIFKAAKVHPDWQCDFTVRINGMDVKAQAFATPHGGQTEKSFKHWLQFCVLPSHPSLAGPWLPGQVPVENQVALLVDGDFSHIHISNLDYAHAIGINMKAGVPYGSGQTQKDDARNGTNQNLKDTALPLAQGLRKNLLLRNGLSRPLDRTDLPWIVERAYDGKDQAGNSVGAFRKGVQLSSFKTVGLNPFTMCPLFTKIVRDTIHKPNLTTKLQLDVAKIQPYVDDADLDGAGEELVKQLMGS